MRRILLLLVGVALLVLPSGAAAGAERHSDSGFLVVKRAAGDGGIYGHPVVTVVVQGFVVGRITQEARVDVYHLQTPAGSGAPQPAGPDVQVSTVRWRSFTGKEYSGSDFRFRAIGGAYRVVVRGSGIYLFAGGRGSVTLHGSTTYPGSDGAYSIDGRRFFSLPKRSVTRPIGGG
jgi:hypothetical protein